MGDFFLLCAFFTIFRLSDKFPRGSLKSHEVVAAGVPVDASAFVGVSTVAGVSSVAGSPFCF